LSLTTQPRCRIVRPANGWICKREHSLRMWSRCWMPFHVLRYL